MSRMKVQLSVSSILDSFFFFYVADGGIVQHKFAVSSRVYTYTHHAFVIDYYKYLWVDLRKGPTSRKTPKFDNFLPFITWKHEEP